MSDGIRWSPLPDDHKVRVSSRSRALFLRLPSVADVIVDAAIGDAASLIVCRVRSSEDDCHWRRSVSGLAQAQRLTRLLLLVGAVDGEIPTHLLDDLSFTRTPDL